LTSKEKLAEHGEIRSLERAAALLDAVAGAGPDGVGLGNLSGAVGLHTSTALHLVKTPESVGFLARQGASKRYRIGSRLFVLAAGALDENALLALGAPVLERLSARTGEAARSRPCWRCISMRFSPFSRSRPFQKWFTVSIVLRR
jgi:IclR family acetate operon transcriptional repressor